MHMILTGESINAKEAEKAGLVAKIYPDDEVLIKAIEHGGSYAYEVIYVVTAFACQLKPFHPTQNKSSPWPRRQSIKVYP
jgi:hypothetical protein